MRKKDRKNCFSHKWFRTTIAITRELSIDIDSRLFRIQPVDHYHHDLLLGYDQKILLLLLFQNEKHYRNEDYRADKDRCRNNEKQQCERYKCL